MQNLKFAFSSIMAHKMRSFLTMIGIIIGVSSVVVIMALGDSMSCLLYTSYSLKVAEEDLNDLDDGEFYYHEIIGLEVRCV